MANATTPPLMGGDTMAELLAQLGDIPPYRVLLRPYPGTATERDVIALHDRENRLCELEYDHLDGGDVLPGFRLSLREWFDEAGRTGRP